MGLFMVSRGLSIKSFDVIFLKIERSMKRTKKDGIFLYIEGLGINSIARFFKVLQQIVFYWIKKYANIV